MRAANTTEVTSVVSGEAACFYLSPRRPRAFAIVSGEVSEPTTAMFGLGIRLGLTASVAEYVDTDRCPLPGGTENVAAYLWKADVLSRANHRRSRLCEPASSVREGVRI